MIKVWNFEFNTASGRAIPNYEDTDFVQTVYDKAFARLVDLERLGFEGVFFSEHHFLDSLSPNPNLLIAALARLTKRMKLGVMGNVLAFQAARGGPRHARLYNSGSARDWYCDRHSARVHVRRHSG
jgi:hypothetical protein